MLVPSIGCRKISYISCDSGEIPLVYKRKKGLIDTSNLTVRNYINTVRGKRSDTKELNINLKTITEAFLRTAIVQKELADEQITIFNKYSELSANFNSLRYLLYGCK